MTIELRQSQTMQNLIEVFCREAQTLVRYRLFARTAEYEGLAEVAGIFRRLAQNQIVYLEGHFELLRGLADPLTLKAMGSTEQNLVSAIAGDQEEARSVYPSFASMADAEGFVSIASWFRTLASSKQSTVDRLQSADDSNVNVHEE